MDKRGGEIVRITLSKARTVTTTCRAYLKKDRRSRKRGKKQGSSWEIPSRHRKDMTRRLRGCDGGRGKEKGQPEKCSWNKEKKDQKLPRLRGQHLREIKNGREKERMSVAEKLVGPGGERVAGGGVSGEDKTDGRDENVPP